MRRLLDFSPRKVNFRTDEMLELLLQLLVPWNKRSNHVHRGRGYEQWWNYTQSFSREKSPFVTYVSQSKSCSHGQSVREGSASYTVTGRSNLSGNKVGRFSCFVPRNGTPRDKGSRSRVQERSYVPSTLPRTHDPPNH